LFQLFCFICVWLFLFRRTRSEHARAHSSAPSSRAAADTAPPLPRSAATRTQRAAARARSAPRPPTPLRRSAFVPYRSKLMRRRDTSEPRVCSRKRTLWSDSSEWPGATPTTASTSRSTRATPRPCTTCSARRTSRTCCASRCGLASRALRTPS
jgi:hypothetical protein